jgi:hypothetical protein
MGFVLTANSPLVTRAPRPMPRYRRTE